MTGCAEMKIVDVMEGTKNNITEDVVVAIMDIGLDATFP